MSKHILVTGGAGFIGSFLVDKLIALGHQVTIFDNLETQVHSGKKPAYLNPRAKFIHADIRNYDELQCALAGIDIIYHEAAAVGVGQSNYEIKRYTDVNVGGTANLLDLLINHKQFKVKKIITTTSMTAYGEGMYQCPRHGAVKGDLRPHQQMEAHDWNIYCSQCHSPMEPLPTPETAPQPCNSIYALTKKAQEDWLMHIGKLYRLPVTALRCFNVYGPRQSLSNPYTGVSAIFISRLKNHQPPVVYEDGLQSRDFVSVHDVVNALILAMNNPAANYQVFNIGTGIPTPIKDIASTLAKVMHVKIQPEINDQPRKNDIRHCFADITKAKTILGWNPQVSLQQGLQELIEWSQTQTASDDFSKATQELKDKGII